MRRGSPTSPPPLPPPINAAAASRWWLSGGVRALSGLSQKAGCPVQEPVREGGAGHGCGHNLLGAGCYAAAVALKDYLIKEKKDGTVIFFGCPAEEGAGSKQFIARAGYFDNVDFAYTWHPETVNEVGSRGSVAIMGANFIFDGIAAHAGGEPIWAAALRTPWS